MKKTLESLFGLMAAAGLLALGSGTAVAGGLVETSPGIPGEGFDEAIFTNSEDITNPWWTLTAYDNYLYYAHGEDECEWNLMEVKSHYTHDFGLYTPIEARIILDRAWVDGDCLDDPDVDNFYAFIGGDPEPEAEESTYDWYAQDALGNIWYLGEDTVDSDDDKGGSFVAGCDGAEAGIVVLGAPNSGDFYSQEFYEDEAEDWGKVKNFIPVEVKEDEWDVCMKTKEWSPLEPGHVEHKFYCQKDDEDLSVGPGELTMVEELKGKTVLVTLIATDIEWDGQDVSDRISSDPQCPLVP